MRIRINHVQKLQIIFSLIFILLNLANTSGLDYEFSEDFSDAVFEGWDLHEERRVEGMIVIDQNHHLEYSSNSLESTGEYFPEHYNIAAHEMNTTYGVWQIDVMYPSERKITEFDWYLIFSDDYYGGYDKDASSYNPNQRTRNGTMIYGSQGRIEVRTVQMTNSGFPNEMIFEKSVSKQWIHYDIVKTPNRIITLVDGKIVGNTTYNDGISAYKHLTLKTNTGSKVKFDNIRVSSQYEEFLLAIGGNSSENDVQFLEIAIICVTVSIVSVITFSYYKSQSMKKVIELAHQSSSSHLSKEIAPLFHSQPKMYYLLLGQTVRNEKNKQKELEELIPQKMYQFRFLLHPYRLAIMKLLSKYDKLSSVEIKERLGLSWGEYSNIIKSLKKKGYISLSDDFEDSSVRRFVFLEDAGYQDFKALTNLLDDFLFKTTDAFDDEDYDTLYPS